MKKKASEAFDGKAAVFIERTPEAEVNVVNTKKKFDTAVHKKDNKKAKFENKLRDSSSDSNSSQSEDSNSEER